MEPQEPVDYAEAIQLLGLAPGSNTPAYDAAVRTHGSDPTTKVLDTSLEACRAAGRVEAAVKKGAKL